MISFSNPELEALPEVKEGDKVDCEHCERSHPIEYGTDKETGRKTTIMGFYKCGENSYLASVQGELIVKALKTKAGKS